MYHILTDTESNTLKVLFISDPATKIPETKYSELIFEVICGSEIINRFDTSHNFWVKFSFQKPSLHKCLSCFAVETINNPSHLTIACNPKECFKTYEDREVNKKNKDIKKGSSVMCFENLVRSIVSVTNLDHFQKPLAEYKKVARLTVDQGKMQKKTSL